MKGDGNQQDYGMRIYDPRLGKFLSVDPLTKNFPWLSSYQYTDNSPIANIDLDGLERYCVVRWYNNNQLQHTSIIAVPMANQIQGRGTLYIELNNTPANVNTYQQLFNVNPNAANLTAPNEATGIAWGQMIQQNRGGGGRYLMGTYSPSNATQADGLRPYEANIAANKTRDGQPIIASDDPNNLTGGPLSTLTVSQPPVTVNFAVGSSVLNANGQQQLQGIIRTMNGYASLTATVTGNTDSDDNNNNNFTLGTNRGNAVIAYAQTQRVNANRFIGSSNGETAPTATNTTQAGKAQNRSATISINYPTQGN